MEPKYELSTENHEFAMNLSTSLVMNLSKASESFSKRTALWVLTERLAEVPCDQIPLSQQ